MDLGTALGDRTRSSSIASGVSGASLSHSVLSLTRFTGKPKNPFADYVLLDLVCPPIDGWCLREQGSVGESTGVRSSHFVDRIPGLDKVRVERPASTKDPHSEIT